jgi:hypothetical protein
MEVYRILCNVISRATAGAVAATVACMLDNCVRAEQFFELADTLHNATGASQLHDGERPHAVEL